MTPESVPVRLTATERKRAQRLAKSLGMTERGLYLDIIREGLVVREQMEYYQKLRKLNATPERAREILALVPDVEPEPYDRLPDDLLPKRKRKV